MTQNTMLRCEYISAKLAVFSENGMVSYLCHKETRDGFLYESRELSTLGL